MAKTIQLFGEELKIAYNLASQVAYEKIMDKAFDLKDLNKAENRAALYYGCIIANNPETNITFDWILREISLEDLSILDNAVNEAMSEWYRIPKPSKLDDEDKAPEEEEEEKSKNL